MILRVCLSVARIELCRVSNQVSLLFLSADNYLICDAQLITWIELQQNCVPIPHFSVNHSESSSEIHYKYLLNFIAIVSFAFPLTAVSRVRYISLPPRLRRATSTRRYISFTPEFLSELASAPRANCAPVHMQILSHCTAD